MDNQLPQSSIPPAETVKNRTPSAAVPAPETKSLRTMTPQEHDPLWEQLGSTRVTNGMCDSTPSDISGPVGQTEISPSRVLGKDVLSLGDFKLIKKLGEGAMGAVYKAEWITRKQIVALKVLFPHVANNPRLVQRLYREGLAAFNLDHPNIVQAYAFDQADGYYYVAMEYVSGRSVQKWIEQLGRLPVADAIRVALDCAKALASAHSFNIIHRDIKPDNILVTKSGVVKVADLGMAKTHDEDLSLTQTGHAVGTPWYMPLEQARNAKEIDGRSDIYALGCTLYALLTGNPPFMGRTIVDVIQAKEQGTFPPARQTNPDVPERLDLILAKMTARLPKYRYQSCEELIKDLESLQLASESLAFVRSTRVDKQQSVETALLAKTNVAPVADKPGAAGATQAAPIDLDVWHVQMKLPDGTQVTRTYKTAQMLKMLEEGTITAKARISRSPTEGFRSLATYKEFQGTALSKVAKSAADKSTARYRNLYKKIEEQERDRENQQNVKKKNDSVSEDTRYWIGVGLIAIPIAVAVIGLAYFLYWLITNLFAF